MGKSPGLAIVLTEARLSVCLGALALLLSLPCDSGVGAVTFAFSGFQGNSLHLLSNSSWNFNSTSGCFKFDPTVVDFYYGGASGRLLYPFAVQMIDPGSTTVKSFSTTFIYQIHRESGAYGTGPGMAFIIVPDDITIGASWDFMGLITEDIAATPKNYESDNHTLGVELDTYLNPEFNDPNGNHIGINLASMNSTYSFEPVYSLASSSAILYRQIWIDYDEADSRMDIYYANYNKGKPAKPQGSQSGLDLSLLQESMFAGFSSASKLGSYDVSYVCAWSFSNDGIPAPSIVIATPGSPQAPPLPPPSPISPSPNGSATPPPINMPAALGVSLTAFIVSICLFSLFWCKVWRRPFRIFISHTGGKTVAGKNFPSFLHREMTSRRWSRSKFHVKPFLDVVNCPAGLSFAKEILKELERFDVGIVVVTPDFFSRHWPMTELIKFVEVQMKDRERRIRVLPLFYELTPDEVAKDLNEGNWEQNWVKLSVGNHPLQLQECRDAVSWLRQQKGIRYVSQTRDIEYIDTILNEVDNILCSERSIAADLRWAMKKLNYTRSGPTAT